MGKKLLKKDGSCAPLALQYLSKMPDAKVLEICTFNGFEQDVGMEEFEFLDAARDMGIILRRINLKKAGVYRYTLRRILKHFPEGQYLVYTHAHLFVIHDGGVVDPVNPGYLGLDRKVTGLWKLI